MANDEEFFVTREDWSRRKHLILGYYLKPAIPKLATQSQDRIVVLLDAFAGRGTYDDDSPGSPLISGRIALEAANWQNSISVQVHNCEPDTEKYNSLQSVTTDFRTLNLVANYNVNFQTVLSEIIRESDLNPLFAFLDPFKPSQLLFTDFEALLTRNGVTDIIIMVIIS